MPALREFRSALQANDRHYAWKLGFRILLIAVDLALTGMLIWVLTSSLSEYINYSNWVYDNELLPYDFIPIGLSIIYCAVVVVLHMVRRRPIHPGIDVGTDLLLWMAFAVLGGFTITIGIDNVNWVTYNDPFDSSYSSSSGYYTTAANGSNVYINSDNAADCPRFDSCEQQSSFVHNVGLRGRVELAVFALMYIAMIVHFILFVWACVDTQRRNSSRGSRDARDIAQAMIAEMVANGQLAPPQQPLLFPGASQRASQAGSQNNLSREDSGNYVPGMPAVPAVTHEFYAPNGQAGPYVVHPSQPYGLWPMPQQAHVANEKQVPMQAYTATPPLWAAQGNAPVQAVQPPSPGRQPPSPPNHAASNIQTPNGTPSPPAVNSNKRLSNPPDSPTPNGIPTSSGSDIPPTQPLAVRRNSQAKVEPGSTSPAVPQRAPGHTVNGSRRISAQTYRLYSQY